MSEYQVQRIMNYVYPGHILVTLTTAIKLANT